MKLFIGNLSYDIDDDGITKFFASVDAEVKAARSGESVTDNSPFEDVEPFAKPVDPADPGRLLLPVRSHGRGSQTGLGDFCRPDCGHGDL